MKKRILCYGDSNTYGYLPAGNGRRYSEGVRWPSVLQKLLGEEYTVIEEGLCGRTTDAEPVDEPWKNGESYLCAALSTHRPIDMAVFMLGTNDLKASFHRTAETIAAGMKTILEQTNSFLMLKQEYLPKILLIAPAYINDTSRGPFGDEFDQTSQQMSRLLASQYKTLTEEYDALFLDAAEFAATSPRDGLHLDAENHRRLGEAVYELIRDWYAEHPETDPKHEMFDIHE